MNEFTYGDGTKLLSECRHQANTWGSVTEWAHGEKGSANVSGSQIDVKNGQGWSYKGPKPPDAYQVEHDDLMDAIRQNKPYNEAEYGAHSTMTSILGRMASYSGQQIKWDDAINAEVSVMPKNFAFDAQPPTLPNKEGRYPIPMPGQSGDENVWQRVNAEIISWSKGGKRPAKTA
jgi:hypothetical protein